MRRPAALRMVDPIRPHRPRYAREGDVQTLKYPGELVLENELRPVLIVRAGGKLERWNGIEGREGCGVHRG